MSERDAYIIKMVEKANALVKNYTWDANNELWDMASEWNRNHEEREEIFMCEIEADTDHENGGFMIEDDVWYF